MNSNADKIFSLNLSGKFLVFWLIFLITGGCMPKVASEGGNPTSPHISGSNFVASDGIYLPFRKWLPTDGKINAVVVALHGFNDYSKAFEIPSSYFTSRNIALYAYDQRGFGEAPNKGLWGGIDAYTEDLNSFCAVLKQRYPSKPLFILGESMGGAVAMVAASAVNPPKADGMILVAPAVWGRETMPWYQTWLLALSSHTIPWMKLTGSGLKIVPSDNIEMRRGLSRDPLVIKETRIDSVYGLTDLMDEALYSSRRIRMPALFLYGEKDQVIPREPTMKALSSMPETAKSLSFPEGYHMLLRDLGRDKPLAAIAVWIENISRKN